MTYTMAVIGAQWGDEGKGKVTGVFSRYADVVARWGGGNNAGHTIVVDGVTYKFNLLPSGVFVPGTVNVMGKGMTIDTLVSIQEILDLARKGIHPNLKIANQAHIICDWHRRFDVGFEALLKDKKVDTTQRGVGPCAEDKASRKRAVRFEDIIDEERCNEKMRMAIGSHAPKLVQFHPELQKFSSLSLEDIVSAGIKLGFEDRILSRKAEKFYRKLEEYAKQEIDIYLRSGQFLKQYACAEVRDEIVSNQNGLVVLEGAQGHLLDLDQGTFPDVTSTSPLIAGAQQYLGLARDEIHDVIGVFKAYCTRVGNGVFDTEAKERMSNILREKGNEYGTTTNRPRRCGWFNITEAKDAVDKQGIDWLAITKLDVLDDMKEILVGERLENGKIKYHRFKGWEKSTRNIRTYKSLPSEAKAYLKFLSKELNRRIGIVTVGPDEKETIFTSNFKEHLEKKGVRID